MGKHHPTAFAALRQQAQCWFGFVPLGVQGVSTLFMELAGGFSAFSLNINTAVLAAPLGSTF